MPTLDLVEALQFASEIRLQFLSVGFARWGRPQAPLRGVSRPLFDTCIAGLEWAYLG
jgi:hypothetical protein